MGKTSLFSGKKNFLEFFFRMAICVAIEMGKTSLFSRKKTLEVFRMAICVAIEFSMNRVLS